MPEIKVPALQMTLSVADDEIKGHAIKQFRIIARHLNRWFIEAQRLQVENARMSAELKLISAHELTAERLTNARLTDQLEAAERRIEQLERQGRRGLDWADADC